VQSLEQADDAGARESRRVAASQAPLRRTPSDSALLDTEALRGELATVLETNGEGWARVRLADDGYVGWMRQCLLAEPGREPTHKISALRTFAFAEPDIKSPPLEALPLGARVAVVGEAEDRNARYALIAPAGAVVVQHLDPLESFQSDWVAVAERFLGVPYLWGGKTALGLDCSGLVQLALQACGIAAPRDTGEQQDAVGTALAIGVGLPALQRGDFVFWKGHVGIMRDAATLLHANSHHMAVAAEPLSHAIVRTARRGISITSVRRLH
jgi:cell wall-associated NlpC family hydrolase